VFNAGEETPAVKCFLRGVAHGDVRTDWELRDEICGFTSGRSLGQRLRAAPFSQLSQIRRTGRWNRQELGNCGRMHGYDTFFIKVKSNK